MKFGFYADLRGIQFSEGNKSWIQAMPLGEYKHPIHGVIKFDEERSKRFADNVNNNVVGTALDIDYDHKAYTGKAAGWVQQAESRGAAGLHLLIEWTPEAVQSIRNGEYRYFSPEYADAWTHPKSQKEFKDVLRGGGITNRPFLKDILPVNLSELSFENPSKEAGVTPKELRESLGLPETATDDEVRAKLSELQPKPPAPPAPPAPAPVVDEAKLNELVAANPALKALTDLVTAQSQQIATLIETTKRNQVSTRLSEADRGKQVMSPAAKEAMEKLLLGESVADNAEAFLKLLAEGNAIVETGERGSGNPEEIGLTDAEKIWDERVAKAMSEQKIDYAAAAEQVAKADPKLFKEYREASTAFKA